MNQYGFDEERWAAERKRWLEDPFTSGVVVRHKASGITMVVIGKALGYSSRPKDRTCSWMADNRRYQDDFDLCELERVDSGSGTIGGSATGVNMPDMTEFAKSQ